MVKYQFNIVGNQLVVSLTPVDNNVEENSMSYMSPSFKNGNGKLNLYESGIRKQSFLFTEIGDIQGSTPISIEDAFNLLTNATANFNGGGIAPQTTETQRTTQTSGNNGNITSQNDIYILHEAGVTSSFTIPFPSNPRNAQKFYIHSVGGIVSLVLTATVGSILSIVTTISAGVTIGWIYNESSNKWYKIQ